jgi:hypothetical protein
LDVFSGSLAALHLENCEHTAAAILKLEALDVATAGRIRIGFTTAKTRLQLRLQQVLSFSKEAPWSLMSVMEIIVAEDLVAATVRSRQRAKGFLADFIAGELLNVGVSNLAGTDSQNLLAALILFM